MVSIPSERRKTARDDDPELRGRRADPRAYVVLAASAEALSGNFHVTLLDVSRTGARVEGSKLPEIGKDIVLRCGGIDTFAIVAWAASGRCGIQFDEPIGVGDLVALRALAQESEHSELTPDERRAAADWMNGLAR